MIAPDPRAWDLWILDRVFTPVAHWAHDQFGWRGYQIGRACLIGIAIDLVFQREPIVVEIVKALMGTICCSIEFGMPVHRIGFANSRRYTAQPTRLIWSLILVWSLLQGPWLFVLWMLGGVLCVYFSSVTDKPRKPRRASAPVEAALAGV